MLKRVIAGFVVCLLMICSWFVLSLHVVVQRGCVRVESVSSEIYVACRSVNEENPMFGDDFIGYDGLLFSDWVLSDSVFEDGRQVCVIRLCSWFGFYKNIQRMHDVTGKDCLVGLYTEPRLERVWLPALVLPMD